MWKYSVDNNLSFIKNFYFFCVWNIKITFFYFLNIFKKA